MRRASPILLLALAAIGAPHGDAPVPLRDLRVESFEGRGRLQRSRAGNRPGIHVGGERHRGLAWAVPGRARFALNGDFARLTVSVAVADGGSAPVRFTVRGDGRVLASTPPLFPGEAPLPLAVDLGGVRGLELAADGAGSAFAAWIDGRLFGAEGRDLGDYRALAVSFSPQEYPASFKRRVNESIDRGVRALLLRQRPDGTWSGHRHETGQTALAALALLKAGVKGDSPEMTRAFERLAAYDFDHVYTVSVLLMALEARWFPGGADPKAAREVIPDADMAWIRRAAEWLEAQQGAGFPPNQRAFHPVWRYPSGGYDLSNTQYALFGLSAAERCGVRSKAWLPALKYLLAMQEEEGPEVEVSRYFRDGRYARRRVEKAEARGFGYTGPASPTGSMTSAGLCSLVLCQAALDGTRRFAEGYRGKTRRAIRDALAWLEEYYDVEENPFRGHAWWLYYLFNLERVGVLLDQRYLGTHDWYFDGAEVLMARQDREGGWGSVVDTSFALLFLKRGTVPPLTQGKRRG